MNNNIKITFDESAKKDILDFFNKTVNEDNLIVEKKDTQPVYTFERDNITVEEFGGIQKGSEVFIKKDIISLMRLTEFKP